MANQMYVRLDTSMLERVQREVPGKMSQAIQKMAQDMEGDVKTSFSPTSPSAAGDPPGVDTGNLKNSIIASPENPLRWIVGVGADYGIHLEYGTSRMAPRPFMLPAFERTVSRAPQEIRDMMRF